MNKQQGKVQLELKEQRKKELEKKETVHGQP